MRIAVLMKPTDIPGGHIVQFKNTVSELRKLGIDVDTPEEAALAPREYDLVHVFWTDLSTMRRVRQARKPIVVSTIYQSKEYLYGLDGIVRGVPRLRRKISASIGAIKRGMSEETLDDAERILMPITERRFLFEAADLLLPNSYTEGRRVVDELGVSTPWAVVRNGFDQTVFHPPAENVSRSGVLVVARLEPRKNQMGLIRALRGTGIHLTMTGYSHPHHPEYLNKCLKAGGDNVTYIAARDSQEIARLYQKARVHALPSWFETTGLASLEAAACGCAIVSTRRGDAEEYFGSHAHYCDPSDQRSIREAVEAAYEQGADQETQRYVASRYTWTHVAEQTLAAYKGLLAV